MNLKYFVWPVASYYFEQPWTLDGVTYTFTLRYNLRIQTWMLDVGDVIGAPIVCGIPLIAGRDLLGQYAGRGLPSGLLFVFDPSDQNGTPGQDDFSAGYRLVYAGSGA
jgi:hypothetical protein